jgi:hypothetical protein
MTAKAARLSTTSLVAGFLEAAAAHIESGKKYECAGLPTANSQSPVVSQSGAGQSCWVWLSERPLSVRRRQVLDPLRM